VQLETQARQVLLVTLAGSTLGHGSQFLLALIPLELQLLTYPALSLLLPRSSPPQLLQSFGGINYFTIPYPLE